MAKVAKSGFIGSVMLSEAPAKKSLVGGSASGGKHLRWRFFGPVALRMTYETTSRKISMRSTSFLICMCAVFLIAGECCAHLSAFQQDTGTDGIVSIEVEHFDTHTPQGGHSWSVVTPSGFSGESALKSLPNSGAIVNTGYITGSPRLDYRVNFVKTGTHHIWARGIGASGSDDSYHAGLNGQAISTSDRISSFTTSWTWSKKTMDSSAPATFNVPTAGEHILNVWMREDGFVIDKIVITTNPSYIPSGLGPPESSRNSLPPPNTPPVVNAGQDQSITLPTHTINLAATVNDDGLPNPPASVTVQWSKLSGPGDVIFGSSQALSTTAQFSVEGAYVLRLTASDSELQASDDMGTTVNPPVETTPPPGETSFTDNFERTSVGPSWTIVAGTWLIDSGKLYHRATSAGIITLNVPLEGNDYDAEASFQFTSLVSGNHRGVILRYQNASNFYYGQYHRDNRKFRIIKVQNGVWTTLAELTAPSVSNYTYHPIRFSAEGTNLKLYFDGAQRLEASDATFGTGKVGVYSRSYYHKFDNFQVTALNVAPPAVTVDSFPSLTNQNQATVAGTKSAGAGIYSNGLEICPVSNETAWSAALALAREGENQFSITARKLSGQESEPVSITVVRDTVPPDIQFSRPAPNSYVNQPQTLVYGTVDGVEFSMITELREGANTVTKTAVDAAGNESTETLPLILDTVAPSIQVISPSYNAWVANPEVTIRYECEDDRTICSSHDLAVNLENEGVNDIPVVHTDLAGNIGVARHILRLDSIPPAIEFTSHGEGQKVRSTQETVIYTIDGQPGSILFPLVTEGSNVLEIVAEDPAHNFTIATLTLIRDTTPPNFTVTFPEQGAYVNRAEVVL